MGLKIHYKKEQDGIRIYRCFGGDEFLQIPDYIENMPVKHIEPYTFSLYKRMEEQDIEVYTEHQETGLFADLPLLAGGRLKAVRLPAFLESLGAYAFYGCANLKTICCSDYLKKLSAGILTGCKLDKIEITFYGKSEKSCLKELVGEITGMVEVMFHYAQEGQPFGQAKLIFPEFYEEDVEIATARIFESHCIGSGIYYRQCFLNQKIEYERYDRLFQTAVAQDCFEIVFEIALARIEYPFRLSDKWKAVYLDFIKANISQGARLLVETDRIVALKILSTAQLWSEDGLTTAIERAATLKKTVILSYLMDEKKRCFPKRRKRYEL